MREALVEDAKRILANFESSYKDCTESSSISQVTEMLEYIVVENQHECLGVSPLAL